jgi:heme oxygenase
MRLNSETRVHHAEVDSTWHDLITIDVTQRRYLDQLVRVYGFEAPLEGALAYGPHAQLFERRDRSGLLASDLLMLGLRPVQIAQLPQCPAIAPFASMPDALGWLYVLERSTLVHGAARRHLVGCIPDLERATSYLAASEASLVTRWRELGGVLDRAATSPAIEDQIAAAAATALAGQRRWLAR